MQGKVKYNDNLCLDSYSMSMTGCAFFFVSFVQVQLRFDPPDFINPFSE